MSKLPGISHQRAVKAFEKRGFWIARQGKHIAMTNGERIITIPRANPVDAFTMGGIIRDAGLTVENSKSFCENIRKSASDAPTTKIRHAPSSA
jgi:predicted RNA binding protein YcfA (HicA-like mRNA interferase family)